MEELECEHCGWWGVAEELVCSDEDMNSKKKPSEIKFNLCPDCERSSGLIDISDEVEDE
jgi:hypothetical protein